MHAQMILAPMGALAALTFVVLALVPIARFKAAFAGKVVSNDFTLGESTRVPAEVSLPNRNYMNLLELPVLFYVVCVICLVTRTLDAPVVGLAWAYVVFRALHTLVHITYNNVFHRLTMFAASNVILLAMWIWVYVRLYG